MRIGSDRWKGRIREAGASLGVDLFPEHLEAFSVHARELLFWNRTTNLTRITDPEQIALKHFADSLAPIRWIEPGATVLDIGSGAGFPGIPIKVIRRGVAVTLIDGVRKKVSFLKHVIRLLGLDRIDALHVRAERLPSLAAPPAEAPGGRYDVIVSRAAASLDVLAPLALPLIGENGILVAMVGKTGRTASIPADPPVALELIGTFDYRLPGSDSARSILCLRPHGATTGFPSKERQ